MPRPKTLSKAQRKRRRNVMLSPHAEAWIAFMDPTGDKLFTLGLAHILKLSGYDRHKKKKDWTK